MTTCTTVFTCASEFEIVGVKFEGHAWFCTMVMAAFWLQIAANFIWLQNSQLAREIMQLDIGSKPRRKLVLLSLLWTAFSTVVWIARIMLIIGNNLWIYATVLLGNVVGTYWASTTQKPDKHSLVGDLEALLLSRNPKVNAVLRQLSERMRGLTKAVNPPAAELDFSYMSGGTSGH